MYEGDWTNDKKNGEGTIIKRSGEVIVGDFRGGVFEGKQRYERTLNHKEVEVLFK